MDTEKGTIFIAVQKGQAEREERMRGLKFGGVETKSL